MQCNLLYGKSMAKRVSWSWLGGRRAAVVQLIEAAADGYCLSFSFPSSPSAPPGTPQPPPPPLQQNNPDLSSCPFLRRLPPSIPVPAWPNTPQRISHTRGRAASLAGPSGWRPWRRRRGSRGGRSAGRWRVPRGTLRAGLMASGTRVGRPELAGFSKQARPADALVILRSRGSIMETAFCVLLGHRLSAV